MLSEPADRFFAIVSWYVERTAVALLYVFILIMFLPLCVSIAFA